MPNNVEPSSDFLHYFEDVPDIAIFAKNLKIAKVVKGENGPYLTRYILGGDKEGAHAYLHFFHRGDVDLALHNHPWSGRSYILQGGYIEERRVLVDEGKYAIDKTVFIPGMCNIIYKETFHRVDLINPREGCWTMFIVGKRQSDWGFWDRNTGLYTPGEDYIEKRGLTYDGQSEK